MALPLYPSHAFVPGPSAPVPPLSTIQPTLKDLVCYAVPRVAPAWYDVGLQLDLEPDILDEIEKDKSDQPRRMFAKLLQGSSCSWLSVLNAVEKIRGTKPMEDIQTDVVESLKHAQTWWACVCLRVICKRAHKLRKAPYGLFLIPDIAFSYCHNCKLKPSIIQRV